MTPPGLTWRFVDDRHIEIHKAPGYDRSALYEFIYEAKDPIVLGAGLAGIRDFNAFLRYETADAAWQSRTRFCAGMARPCRMQWGSGFRRAGECCGSVFTTAGIAMRRAGASSTASSPLSQDLAEA